MTDLEKVAFKYNEALNDLARLLDNVYEQKATVAEMMRQMAEKEEPEVDAS